MVHRAPKRPCVSVILAARNADGHLSRALESVLNQTFTDLELIVVDCASTDRTAAMCERFADRDIRVETMRLDSESKMDGRRAALSAARGVYILFLNQSDWLNPAFLAGSVAAAQAHAANLVIPELSVDSERSDGSRVSSALSHETCFWETAEQFRAGASGLIENGVLAFAAGKLFRRETLGRFADSALELDDEQAFMLEFLRDMDRVGVVEGSRYHLSRSDVASRPIFDACMFERCERDHERVLELYRAWGIDGDEAAMAAAYRRFLRGAVRCIENATSGTGQVTSLERRELVQKIIDAPSTRESVDALRDEAHEFGIMYAPIVRRNAVACCMGARIQEIVGRALVPFVPATGVARI